MLTERYPLVETLFVVLMMLVLTACGGEQAARVETQEPVVASVDSLRITAADLHHFAVDIPAGLRPKGEPDSTRGEYLRSLVAKTLLYLEAKRQRLDTLASVRSQVDTRWRQRLIRTYRQEAVRQPTAITDEMVERHIADHQLTRRRLLAGILVDDRETAELALARLDSGRAFAQVARELSQDSRSADQDGVLGYVSIFQTRRFRIPDELFYELPDGRPSGVLPMGKRFQVICFQGDSLVSSARLRDQVRQQLRAHEQEERECQVVDSLARLRQWRMEPKGLALLNAKAHTHIRLQRRHFSAAEAATPLFSFRGGVITVGDYLDAIWQQPMRALSGWGFGDSLAVVAAAGEVIVGPAMLYTSAMESGIGARPEELRWKREVELEYMVKELRRREALHKAEVSDEEAAAFYQEHPVLFESEPREKALHRARAFVLREKQNALFTALTKRLQQEYASRITVDEEQLAAALPDSLLRRLEEERSAAKRPVAGPTQEH